VGADYIRTDSSRKTQVQAPGRFVFSPNDAAEFLDYFLELKGISMHRYFKFPHSMAAGQVTNGIAGQEKDHSGFMSRFAQLAQRVLLVRRQPVFQKIDVVGHCVPCFQRLLLLPSA
jgi:hypothetical protein